MAAVGHPRKGMAGGQSGNQINIIVYVHRAIAIKAYWHCEKLSLMN